MSSTRDSNIVVAQILERLTENICRAEKALADKSFIFKLVHTKENKAYEVAVEELHNQLAAIFRQLFLMSNPIQMMDDFYYLGDEKLSKEAINFISYSDKLKFIIIQEIQTASKPGRIYNRWVDVLRSANVAKNYMIVMGVLSALISFSDAQLKRMGVTLKSEDKSIIDRLSEFLANPADMMKEFKTSDTIPQMSQLTGDLDRAKERLSLNLCKEEDGLYKLHEINKRLEMIVQAEQLRLENLPADHELLNLITGLNVNKLRVKYEGELQKSPSRGKAETSPLLPSLKPKIDAAENFLSAPRVRRAKTSGSLSVKTKVESPGKKRPQLATSQEEIKTISFSSSGSPLRRRKTNHSSSSHIASRLVDAHSASSLPSRLEQPLSDASSSSMSPIKRRRLRKGSSPDARVTKKKRSYKGALDRSMSTSEMDDRPCKQAEFSPSLPTLALENTINLIKPIPKSKQDASPVKIVRVGSVAERISMFEAIVRKNINDASEDISLLRAPRHIKRSSSEIYVKKRSR